MDAVKDKDQLRFIQTRRIIDPRVDAKRMMTVPNITPEKSADHGSTQLVTPIRRKSLASTITPADSISSVGLETPYSTISEQRVAPWVQTPTQKRTSWRAELPSPPLRAESPVPYWERGGSLLDEHYKSLGQATPRASSLSIPIDDESVAGSPPDSDEDTPSVPLPHSAVKHVQRPTPVQRAASPATTVSGSDETARALAKRMSSGSNNTPLGAKVYGFKVREERWQK